MSRVVDLLAELVAFPTVSDRPVDALAATLATRAEAAGMQVTRYNSGPGKCNVVARAGPRGVGGIALSGHMDVVPTDGQAWTSDPFVLSERDGRLVGRGTADMKGFLAAATVAIEGLDLRDLREELVFVWTHDEEVGCVGAGLLDDQLGDAPLPARLWIGEPTDLRVAHLHPGHATATVRCRGIPAHTSKPHLGLSAIGLATDVLVALRRLEAAWQERRRFEDLLETPWTILSVGSIHGGTAVNIVPETCDVRVGMRALPGVEVAALIEEIRAAIAPVTASAEARGGHVALSLDSDAPALLTDPSCPFHSELSAVVGARGAMAVPFATDGGHLSRRAPQCLVCGPGSIDVAHKPDEFIARAALEGTVPLIQRMIAHRTGARLG